MSLRRGGFTGVVLFCDVRYVTMDELPSELSFIVAQPTSRSNDSANQNEQMEISVIQDPNGCIHKV